MKTQPVIQQILFSLLVAIGVGEILLLVGSEQQKWVIFWLAMLVMTPVSEASRNKWLILGQLGLRSVARFLLIGFAFALAASPSGVVLATVAIVIWALLVISTAPQIKEDHYKKTGNQISLWRIMLSNGAVATGIAAFIMITGTASFLAINKRATFDYTLLDKYEAGLVLLG